MLELWLSAKFILLFISLLTARIVKNSHILAGLYFIILKRHPETKLKVFQEKFGPQQEDRKISYQV